jgi:hypothetical protein
MSPRAEPDLFGQPSEGEPDGHQAQQTQAREAPEEALLICAGCARASAIYDFARDCCVIRWINGQRNRAGAAQWIETRYGPERMEQLRAKWSETVTKLRTA